MPLAEITNAVPEKSSVSSSVNTATSSSTNSTSSVNLTGKESDVHPWAGGKKVLRQLEEGEKMRSSRLKSKSGLHDLVSPPTGPNEIEEAPFSPASAAYGCTADVIDANERLQELLVREQLEKAGILELLEGVRQSHAVVCAQLETSRNEFASQEDELFVLRESHEEHAKELNELRKAKEFAEVERRHASTVADLRSENVVLKKELEKTQKELADAKVVQLEQEEACMELLDEQKKLESAYEHAVAQTNPPQPGASSRTIEAAVDDDAQGWEKIDEKDLTLTPPSKGKTLGRKGTTTRFLSKRRRTPSQPLLFGSTPMQDDVQVVKNDVQQLKHDVQ
ncbi:hypothetical protein JCM8547_000992 [Rhodosporidiobolus lusitaniae]